MGAPVKCGNCGAQWYRMGMAPNLPCIECQSGNVDVDISQPYVEECEPGDHAFEMDGPPPWKCTFCGYTPELEK